MRPSASRHPRGTELIREQTLNVHVEGDVITITGQCGLQYSMTVGDFAALISRVNRSAKRPSLRDIHEGSYEQ
jgi:hypothetical protein